MMLVACATGRAGPPARERGMHADIIPCRMLRARCSDQRRGTGSVTGDCLAEPVPIQ